MANRNGPRPTAAREHDPIRLFRRIGSALAAGGDLDDTLQRAARAVVEELDARHCTVSVLDDTHLRPVAAAFRPSSRLARHFVQAEPFTVAPPLRSLLQTARARVVTPPQAGRLLPAEWQALLAPEALTFVPARFRDEPLGLVTVDRPQAPGATDRQVLEALGLLVGSGIHFVTTGAAVAEAGRELDELAVLRATRTMLTSADVNTAATVVADLNEILAHHDLEVLDLRVFHSRLLRRLATTRPTPDEARALEEGKTATTLADGTVTVALRRGGEPLGALRVRAGGDRLPHHLLTGLADQLADLTHGLLQLAVLEAAREERAAWEARTGLLARAQTAAGRLFAEIGHWARERAARSPDPPAVTVAGAAHAGKTTLDWAATAVPLVPSGGFRETLQKALRALADTLTAGSEVTVMTKVRGRVRPLDPGLQRLLYQVAVAALIDAATEGRCLVARVQVQFQHRHVQVTVTDDGVPLAARPGWEARSAELRALVAGIGGTLTLTERHPHGVAVKITVPG